MSDKKCISCGMPMTKPADFAKGDPSLDYCVHCAGPDGKLKSYEDTLAGMTGFIMKAQGLDESAARNAAQSMMATMPAWKDR